MLTIIVKIFHKKQKTQNIQNGRVLKHRNAVELKKYTKREYYVDTLYKIPCHR